MSSVSARVEMLGVSGEFFHGIGLRNIGSPSMTCRPVPPPGAKMITSYFDRRLGSRATSWVLMYANGRRTLSNA